MSILTRLLSSRQQARLLALQWRLRPFEREVELACRIVAAMGGGTAIDVGANRGQYTLPMARHADVVHAYEANPDLAQYLKEVAPSNVEVHGEGLSDQPGTAVLRVPVVRGRAVRGRGSLFDVNRFSDLEVDEVEATEVRCVRLDDVFAAKEPLSFVKIDVEGLEEAVLDGGRQTLADNNPVVMVETEVRHGADVRAVFGSLRGVGYRSFCLHSDAVLRPVDVDAVVNGQSETSDATLPSNNFLFARDDVVGRLQRSGIAIQPAP